MIRAVVSVARAQFVIEPLELEPLRERQTRFYTVTHGTEGQNQIYLIDVCFGIKNQSLTLDDSGQVSEVSHFSEFDTCRVQLPGLAMETKRTEMLFVFSF